MKTSRKSLLVIVSLLCIAGSSLASHAAFWIASNIVHVDVQYAVALSYSVRRDRVSLNATVTNNGSPVGAGINVEFYYSLNGGDWTNFTTVPTSHRGVARATYRITVDGEYDFKAVVSFL